MIMHAYEVLNIVMSCPVMFFLCHERQRVQDRPQTLGALTVGLADANLVLEGVLLFARQPMPLAVPDRKPPGDLGNGQGLKCTRQRGDPFSPAFFVLARNVVGDREGLHTHPGQDPVQNKICVFISTDDHQEIIAKH